jgi:hypothetical protein
VTSRPTYILGTDGKIENPAKYSVEELLKIVGANTGNLMFQYAVAGMIGGKKEFIGFTGLPYVEAAGCKDGSCLVFPAANHLRTGADWSGLCGFLEQCAVPLIVLGLGAQADSTSDPRATAQALQADTGAMRLVKALRDKAAWISVRGEFTAAVCELLGLKDVDVLGCPSLMLNPHPDAGERIARKLKQAKQKDSPRIAVTAASPFEIKGSPKESLERQLFNILCSGDGLYIQQSGGEMSMAFAMLRFSNLSVSSLLSIRQVLDPSLTLDDLMEFARKRLRVYFDAEKWIQAMQSVDLCLGTRLHGNMAAMAASTPGCIISHDSRTDELASAMGLPRLDSSFLRDATETSSLLGTIFFNAAQFDRARAEKRATYARKLSSLGLAGVPAAA